jgi:hypothetical protein
MILRYPDIRIHNLPVCSVTVGICAELVHAAIADLQFLEKAAVRVISGRQRRDRDFVPGLQAAAVSPAQPGFAERAHPSHLERPLLDLAVGYECGLINSIFATVPLMLTVL